MQGLILFLLAIYLFVVPGYALLGQWGRAGTLGELAERVGVAIALSVALYPLLFVAAWFVGVAGGGWVVWGPGAVGLASLLWRIWRSRAPLRVEDSKQSAEAYSLWAVVCLVGVVAVIGWTRWQAARGMFAPAWGDSVHHVMIVQLMLEHRGLFQSWLPYAPLETFTYHAGLHSNLTVWATATGMAADQAVLWGGQLLNIFAVLTLFPLAYRLSGRNIWVGVLTLAVAGLLSSMPGYYTNWGRYTQLGGLIILPVLVWGFERLWGDLRPRVPWLVLWLALLAAGLALTHYRVAMVGGGAGAAWAVWGLWLHRRNVREWLRRTAWAGLAAVLGATLAAPWLLRLGQGHLTTVAGAISAPADSQTAADELFMWTTTFVYYPRWLVAAAGIGMVVAIWRVPRLGIPLALWAGLAFLATNPALVGLRGSGLISSFLLLIGFYVVFAPALGWLLWWAGERLLIGAQRVSRGLGYAAAGALVIGGLAGAGWGARAQATLIEPANELVFAEDLVVMDWIAHNTPADARFLANGFLAFDNLAVVGSDAGWWLPYYARREVNVLPITYTMETVAPHVDKAAKVQTVLDVAASAGEPAVLAEVLCRAGITHLYQGQRQGLYATPHEQLFQEAWLVRNPDFQLLYREGGAAVWAFVRAGCP